MRAQLQTTDRNCRNCIQCTHHSALVSKWQHVSCNSDCERGRLLCAAGCSRMLRRQHRFRARGRIGVVRSSPASPLSRCIAAVTEQRPPPQWRPWCFGSVTCHTICNGPFLLFPSASPWDFSWNGGVRMDGSGLRGPFPCGLW